MVIFVFGLGIFCLKDDVVILFVKMVFELGYCVIDIV